MLNVGHCHPRVVAAATEQLGRLTHVSNLYYTEPALRLSKALADSSLGGKVFLCNSGAEANEAAIKLARRAKPRGQIVVARDAFHGRTYGALSATPQESKQAPFAPLVPGFVVVAKDPEAIEQAVGADTAAVLIEPIQGESGVQIVPDDVLLRARAACDRDGGRTDLRRGADRDGSHRDAVGVSADAGRAGRDHERQGARRRPPIGALITGERLADILQPGDHGSTFAGGPVACTAALSAIEMFGSGTAGSGGGARRALAPRARRAARGSVRSVAVG